MRPPVTRSRWRALPRSLVAVRDAHRLCYAPTRSVGDDDLSSLETRRTLDEDVLGGLSQMLPRRATKRPRPRTRYPGALKAGVRAPRLIVQRAAHRARPAASEAKGLRRRCDGAVPGRDRWHGSSVFSSPPPSRVLRMGQPYARQKPQPVPHRRLRAPGRLLRETRGGPPRRVGVRERARPRPSRERATPPTRRIRMRERERDTKRRLPRRLPRLRQGPKWHDRRLGAAAGARGHGPEADRGGALPDDQ